MVEHLPTLQLTLTAVIVLAHGLVAAGHVLAGVAWESDLAGELGHSRIELFLKLLHTLLLVAFDGIQARLEVFEGANKVAGQTLRLGFPLVAVDLGVL